MRSRLVKSCSIAIATLICCGASSGSCNSSNSNFSIGPSAGEVVGVGIAAVAVVATAIIVPVEINKHHHNIQGCVYSTPAGLELRTSDQKVYSLSGVTANVAPGTIVHLHGDRQKHAKNAPGDQVFLVKEIKKTSGPCTVLNATTPSPSSTPATAAAPAQSSP